MNLLKKLKVRSLEKALHEAGFFRSDDRESDDSLKYFIDHTLGGNEEFYHSVLPEIYIAPGRLFGSDKKYTVFLRTEKDRER